MVKFLLNKFILIGGLFSPLFTYSQNLVLNPSFEEYTICPNSMLNYPMEGLKYWYPVRSSPDYLNFCSSDFLSSIPDNTSGYQYPKSDTGYLHNQFSYDFVNDKWDYSEAFGGILSESLKSNTIYRIEFYISRTDYSWAAFDAIDLLFCSDSINLMLSQSYSEFKINPSGNIISDTMNWIKISSCYQAYGNEKYFAVGAFRDSLEIIWEKFSGCSNCRAGYYFDDFSIYECDTCCLDEFPIEEYINIFPNPGNAQNVNVFVSKDNTSKIELFDAAGKLVWHNKFQEFYQKASIPVLAQGVYLWRYISSTGFSKTGKIITIK